MLHRGFRADPPCDVGSDLRVTRNELDPTPGRPTLAGHGLPSPEPDSRLFLARAAGAVGAGGVAGRSPSVFPSIDGGTLDLADFRGGPVLVVNTASRCGFTPQFDGLQALWERYRGRGLTVVGVPSNSFRQELDSAGAVKEFCEVNFALDFPMTGLVEVVGPEAHPFYLWAAEAGYAPAWNFHKLLLDGEGRIVAASTATPSPTTPSWCAAIEALLPRCRPPTGCPPARMMASPPPERSRGSAVGLLSTVVKPVHPEGYRFIAAFAVATLLLFLLSPVALVGLILTVWCYYFFRDPPRVTPIREGLW